MNVTQQLPAKKMKQLHLPGLKKGNNCKIIWVPTQMAEQFPTELIESDSSNDKFQESDLEGIL